MNKILHFDARPAGAGKTYDQLTRIASESGLYVLAVDRREIMHERQDGLERIATRLGTRVHVVQIRSREVGVAGGVENVRVEVEAMPRVYKSGHVLVIVTHAALKLADLSEFEDWHLIVDEVPSFWDHAKFRTSISASLVPQLFELQQDGGVSRIVARQRLSGREIHLDSLAAPLGALHARASDPRQKVMTTLRSWDELARSPQWSTYALWSPGALTTFKSVTVLAADFGRSMALELCRATAPEIQWASLERASSRPAYTPRRLTIKYFAQTHHASRHRFNSAAGQMALGRIAGHLALRSSPLIWTCNRRDEPLFKSRLRAGFLPPIQAGSNAWSHLHEAAMVYSAKPDACERQILGVLGIDPAVVIAAREHDPMYQFISRTSVRNYTSEQPVVGYVYDRIQAEAVAGAFSGRPELEVELELLDLGFAHETPCREDLSSLSPEEKAAHRREQARIRQQIKRARDREEK